MSAVDRALARLESSRLGHAQAMDRAHQAQREAPLGGEVVGWNAKSGQALIGTPGGVIPATPISNGHPSASPCRLLTSGAGRPQVDWIPHRPDAPVEPESDRPVYIYKERLGDIERSESFVLEVKLGGARKTYQLGDRTKLTKSGDIEIDEPELPDGVFAAFSPQTGKLKNGKFIWQNGETQETARSGICSNCRPFVLFAGITNADSPRLDLSSFANPGIPGLSRRKVDGRINPEISLIWRLVEVGGDGLSQVLYGNGDVSETGELLTLPAEFVSSYSYNGYMEIQIGCSIKTADSTTPHWPD